MSSISKLRNKRGIENEDISSQAVCQHQAGEIPGEADPGTPPQKDTVGNRSRGRLQTSQHAGNIKAGASKLPLDRVPGLAKALETDPTLLFMMAVEQLGGDTTELAIRKIFGTLVTENEADWLEEIRNASDHADPNLTTKARSAIRGIFNK